MWRLLESGPSPALPSLELSGILCSLLYSKPIASSSMSRFSEALRGGGEELWEWQLRTAVRSAGNHPGAVAGIYSGHRPGGLSPQPVGSEVPLRWPGFENPGTEIPARPLARPLACLPACLVCTLRVPYILSQKSTVWSKRMAGETEFGGFLNQPSELCLKEKSSLRP